MTMKDVNRDARFEIIKTFYSLIAGNSRDCSLPLYGESLNFSTSFLRRVRETVGAGGCFCARCRFPLQPQVMHYSPPGEEICPFAPPLGKRILAEVKKLPSFQTNSCRAFSLKMACSLLYRRQQRGSETGLTKKITRRNFR
jgi:hypothetical protein